MYFQKKEQVSILSDDNETMSKNCVNSIHQNGNCMVRELSHSTDLSPGLCLTENVASKADDQCIVKFCTRPNPVCNNMTQETIPPIYDINYAGMEDKVVSSIMYVSHRQKYSDCANLLLHYSKNSVVM